MDGENEQNKYYKLNIRKLHKINCPFTSLNKTQYFPKYTAYSNLKT